MHARIFIWLLNFALGFLEFRCYLFYIYQKDFKHVDLVYYFMSFLRSVGILTPLFFLMLIPLTIWHHTITKRLYNQV